jgi:hypothetical protein
MARAIIKRVAEVSGHQPSGILDYIIQDANAAILA